MAKTQKKDVTKEETATCCTRSCANILWSSNCAQTADVDIPTSQGPDDTDQEINTTETDLTISETMKIISTNKLTTVTSEKEHTVETVDAIQMIWHPWMRKAIVFVQT